AERVFGKAERNPARMITTNKARRSGHNVVPLFQTSNRGEGGTDESRLPGLDLPGLLPAQLLEALKSRAKITADHEILGDQIQPASVDLRLGSRAYRIKASFLPGKKQSVAQQLEKLKQHEFSLDGGDVLEQGCVYLVKLQERLSLPSII